MASAHLMCDQIPDAVMAIDQALKIEVADPLSNAIYIQTLSRTGKNADIENLLKTRPWLEEDAFCLMELAQHSLRSGLNSKAQSYLYKAIAIDPFDPTYYESLCHAIVKPVKESIIRVSDLRNRTSELLLLESSIELGQKALRLMSEWEDFAHKTRTLHAISDAYFFLDRKDEFYAASQQIVELNPSDEVAQFKVALFEILERKDYLRAVERLEKLTGENADKTCAMLASVYATLGRLEDSQRKLSEMLLLPEKFADMYIYARTAIAIAQEYSSDQIAEVLDRLEMNYSDSADVLLAVAQEHVVLGQNDRALLALDKADTATSNKSGNRIKGFRAHIHIDKRQFIEASEIFAKYFDIEAIDNSDLYEWVYTLYKCDRLRVAGSLAKIARHRAKKFIRVVSDIEKLYLKHYGSDSERQEFEDFVAQSGGEEPFRVGETRNE